jgi:hypothetical protein
LGLTVAGATLFHAEPNDPETVIHGSIHRQFCTTPTINRKTLRNYRAHNDQYIKSHITKLQHVYTYKDWRWKKRYTYTETQLLLLDAARERWDQATKAEKEKFKKCKLFPKDEMHGQIKQTRIIVNRTLEWLSFMGPIMSSVEDATYVLPQFCKHVTEKDRIRIVTEVAVPFVEILEGDYTSFESSFDSRIIESCEWLLVKHCVGHLLNTEQLDLLKQDMMGVSHFRHRHFTIQATGRRKSGDAHTSLANGFTNFMLYRFAMLQQGQSVFVAENVRVEGDDSAGAAPGVDRAFFERVMLELGFTLKLKVHRDPERITFCQTQHTSNGDIIRDPRPILVKFGWSKQHHVQFNITHRKMLLRAKAMSLAATLPGCPIVWALAACAIRLTDEVLIDWDFIRRHLSSWEREHAEYAESARPASYEARVRVEEDFGISIPSQMLLEDILLNKKDLSPIEHPLLHDILPRDWFVFYDVMASGPVPNSRDARLVALIN